MGSADELKVRQLLERCKFYWENKDYDQTYAAQYRQSVQDADLFLSSDLRSVPDRFSLQVLVLFAETVAVDPACAELAERYVRRFLQYPAAQDQFFVRAQLLLSTLEATKVTIKLLKGQAAVDQTKTAFACVQKALEVILKPENKLKYQFLIYNVTVAAWKVLRPMAKTGFAKQVGECFERLYTLLEEMDDPDVGWRVRVMQALVNCYLDGDRKPDAQKLFDKIWDVLKRKGTVSFQEALWRLRVHIVKDNSGSVGSVKKEAEQQKGDLKFHITLQQIKSSGLPEAQVEKELTLLLSQTPGPDALAETARVALQYNLIPIAKQALSGFGNVRQPTLRSRVWVEYAKAELMVRESSLPTDPKTGMKKSVFDLKRQELLNRLEALKIMDRTMVANKRLSDPDVTTEGCILIWNICKPLLTESNRSQVYKPLQVSSSFLEEIDSPLHEIRICIYLELAKYELQEGFIAKADANIEKAFMLDSSILLQKTTVQLLPNEDPGILQRPLERYLALIRDRLRLKKNIYKDPETPLDQAIADMEAVRPLEASNAKETLLRRILANLQLSEQKPSPRPEDLVPEEVSEYDLRDSYRFRKELKDRHLLASQLASEAFSFGYDDIATAACDFTFTEIWDVVKDIDQVAAQANAHYVKARLYGNELLGKGYEVGYAKGVRVDEDVSNPVPPDESTPIPEEEKLSPSELDRMKSSLLSEISLGLGLATSIKQAWLVTNGAVILWNLYLPVLRVPEFEAHIYASALDTFKQVYESMMGFVEKQQLVANPGTLSSLNRITDLNYPRKMQVLCSVAVVVLRMELSRGQPDNVMRLAEGILMKAIPSQFRKEVESIRGKALTLKQTGAAASKGAGKTVESGTSEILSLLESAKVLAAEPSKKQMCLEALKKSFTLMSNWRPQEDEEGDLQIHAEIWTKLGRQAINFPELTKMALVSAERSLQFKKKGQLPPVRQRWYSVAEHLYGETLVALINPQKQEQSSQEFLLTNALDRFVSAAKYGQEIENGDLIIAPARAMFNAAIQAKNQRILMASMSEMAGMLVRLKDRSDLDFLVIFYKVLLDSVTANEAWEQGESLVEAAMSLLPASHQKLLWESQMLFLSKQGKNVIGYIARMKENNPLMQARLWLKLARSSTSEREVRRGYCTAIDILRADGNVELAEVLVEWAGWLRSKGEQVEEVLMTARDILLEIEVGEEEEEPAGPSNGSSSSRRSSLRSSKRGSASVHSKKSSSNTSKSRSSKQSNTRSKRGTSKRTKSKQSRLASREAVDTHPEALNATHLERLVRIQVMLAEVATSQQARRECLLLAHYFITALFTMSLRTYNTAKPDAPVPLPSTPSSWQSFSLPSEVLSFLSSLEDRNAISPYAFEKPKVTHELVWLMAEMMDEMCGLYGHALLVLEFLRVFAVAVWKKPEYLPVYQSWKGRIVARIGGSGDGLVLVFEGVTDPTLRLRIAKELVKRDAIIEAIAGLQGETDPMACAYLAHCYSLQGEVREALNWYHKALSVKDLAVMSEVLPALLKQLTAVKKFEEAKVIFLKTAEVLQNCGYNGELRTKELCARLYLVFAQVNLSESLSPYRRKDEAQRMKVAAKQCFEQFIYIAQKIGCSLPVIQAYLDMEEVWVNSLVLNLRKSSAKKSLSKKADLIETLRSGLRLCHQSLHVFSQHSGPKGPVYMLALVLRRTAELGVLEEQLKRSMVQQPIIASGEDVVSRYIDDISRQIEETKEQWAEKPTRAEKALGKVLSAIQLLHADSPLAKMMRADEVICCELVGGDNNIARAKTILPALVSSKELGLLSNTALLQRLAEAGIRLESQQEDKVKYLNLYQYAAAKKHLFGVLVQAAPSTFKDKLLMNIYDSPSLFDLASLKPSPTTTLMEQRLTSSLAFKVLHLNPTWSDLKSLLSTGSAVLTVQMSPDLSRIYVGFVCVYKDKSMGWSFMDRNLELDDRTNLQEMTEQLDKMRLSLQRTPLNVPEDIERLMAQSEQMVIELKDRLDRLLSFVRPTLSSLISPEQPFEPKPPEDPVPGAKKKPPPAPAGKKGAEEKLDAQLPVPNSGISTLVMCLDQRLAGLPFEALPWLGCVPIVTMDFSLANYWYRLSALGAKEDASSVFPLPKDSSKFLLEPSLEPLAAAKVREISEKLMKLKWESSPIASSGLWQRLCSKAGLFLHYLHLGLPDSDVSVLTSLGCSKLVIMVDKFTSLKRYIPSLPSPHAYAELFTLAGAACVVQNSWAIQPLEGGKFCEGLVDGMGAGQTVGVVLFNWKNGAARMLGKAAFRTYGVPLLKL